jgi:hypothetical protein
MKKIILAFFFLSLSGCVQKSVIIDPSQFTILPKLSTVTLAKPGSVIGEISFVDDRADKNKIGVAKTGLGNKDTPLLLYGGVEKYLTQRFSDGLRKRNIQVGGASPYVFHGVIKKLRVDEVAPGFAPQSSACELQIEISLEPRDPKDQKLRWTGTTSAQGTGNVFNTTGSDGPVLDACVNEAIEKFIHNEKIQQALGLELLAAPAAAQKK